MRDVHDGHRKLQVFLVLRAGRRARARIYAIIHARHSVRTAGNIGWHNLGDRLSDLSEKAKTYSPALQANIVLVRDYELRSVTRRLSQFGFDRPRILGRFFLRTNLLQRRAPKPQRYRAHAKLRNQANIRDRCC